MKQIYFATKNKGKVNSVGNILSKYDIQVVHAPLEMPEPRSDDLHEIAKEKVSFAFEKLKKPCIALDTGFYVHSLKGFPKAYVNFALETIGVEGILRLADGKPRECEFINCLAYLDENLKQPLYFESTVAGTLSEAKRGRMSDKKEYSWSDLWLIFIPEGENKTLAEISFGEYEKWREKRYVDSFATKFAEWFLKNN